MLYSSPFLNPCIYSRFILSCPGAENEANFCRLGQRQGGASKSANPHSLIYLPKSSFVFVEYRKGCYALPSSRPNKVISITNCSYIQIMLLFCCEYSCVVNRILSCKGLSDIKDSLVFWGHPWPYGPSTVSFCLLLTKLWAFAPHRLQKHYWQFTYCTTH